MGFPLGPIFYQPANFKTKFFLGQASFWFVIRADNLREFSRKKIVAYETFPVATGANLGGGVMR